MPTLSFKVDEQEAILIRIRMKVAGEENLSRHLRRLVLNRGNENEALLGDISRRLDRLAASVEHGHNLIREHAQPDQSDVHLTLLGSMYLMLYKAADPAMRAYVDGHVDVRAVRNLLGDREDRPMPWELEKGTLPVDNVVAEDGPSPCQSAQESLQDRPQAPKQESPREIKPNGLNSYLRGRLGLD